LRKSVLSAVYKFARLRSEHSQSYHIIHHNEHDCAFIVVHIVDVCGR
jgi:hypothetical protein